MRAARVFDCFALVKNEPLGEPASKQGGALLLELAPPGSGVPSRGLRSAGPPATVARSGWEPPRER